MADLSSGGSAKVQLDPGQSLRVEAEGGTTNVTSLYGAPAGTTAVTGSTKFGPYSVPAMLRVACASGAASYATVRDEPPANALTAAQVAGLQGVVSGDWKTPNTVAGNANAALAQSLAAIAYSDNAASAFDERWANLTGWTLAGSPGMQVSGGLLYSTGSGGAASGANKGISLASGDNFRAVVTISLPTFAGSGGAIVGVSSDAANATPTTGGGAAFGLYFRSGNTVPQQISSGTFSDLTGQPALAIDTYTVTVTVDQTYISVVAVRHSNGEEVRTRRLRSGFTVNNLYLFNSDARGLSGISLGPIGGRKAVASAAPASVYGVRRAAHWSGDGTQDFKLYLPAGYDSRKPLPLVIAFHGNGSDENHWTSNSNGKLMTDALVAAGYGVLGCTYSANKSTWGAQVSLDAYKAAYDWVRSLYPIGPVCFYANSMGGIESLLTLAEKRIPGVIAWAGTAATTNLADNYTGNGGAFTALIDTAYSISGGNYAAATAGHDPMLLEPSVFRGVPMLFIAASDDTAVSTANNTVAFAERVQYTNPVATNTSATGGHSFNQSAYTASVVAHFNAARWA